jgi:dephospho-CoA kinase
MIIGITGTNGSGKGTVVEYLESRGFAHYSARAFLLAEIERRGPTVDRSAMREVGNALRQARGPAYIIETLYAQAQAAGSTALIESVRALAEARFLKAQGALIIAVDADQARRYERIVSRGTATDHLSFEEFVEQEDREMNAPDEWDMNVFGVMALADFTIRNDGTLEDLHAEVDSVLQKLRAS